MLKFRWFCENLDTLVQSIKHAYIDDIPSLEVIADRLEENKYPDPDMKKFRYNILRLKEIAHLVDKPYRTGSYSGVYWQIRKNMENSLKDAENWLLSLNI